MDGQEVDSSSLHLKEAISSNIKWGFVNVILVPIESNICRHS